MADAHDLTVVSDAEVEGAARGVCEGAAGFFGSVAPLGFECHEHGLEGGEQGIEIWQGDAPVSLNFAIKIF